MQKSVREGRIEERLAVTKSLKVLLLEDSTEDAELVLRELRSAGYTPDCACVQTEEAYRSALAGSEWDIIICDYRMPQFSVPEALRVLQEHAVDTPFIVVSGTVGEDIAIECMRAGAVDFLPKNRLLRLGPAISREVQEVAGRRARRRAENALRRSEASARKIVSASSEGLVMVDSSHRVRFVNPAAERMLGAESSNLVGAKLPLSLPVADETVEVDLTSISGEPVVVEIGTSHIDWAEQESILVIMHDITMRKRAETQLRASFFTLADTLSRAMASRDPYTTDHQQRVAAAVSLVGSRMGLDEGRLWELRLGGLLHDVGKIAVPESLLTKPGKLTREEFDLAQTHPQEGYAILKDTGLPTSVALMALHHHEFLDGTGYPCRLMAEDLSIEDRILAACNLVESLTSFRPYRRAIDLDAARSQLVVGSGTRYDPEVVACLTELIERGEYLSGGS